MAGLLLEALYLLRLLVFSSSLVEAIALQMAAHLIYLTAVYYTLRRTTLGPAAPSFIVLASLLFRITCLPLQPLFSDDLYRYRWEGALQVAGGNPYQVRPNDPAWRHLQDELFARVPLKEFKAGYGPLIEGTNWLAYRLTPSADIRWSKWPWISFELFLLLALLLVLRRRGLPTQRVLLYAWCPLPIIEFWAEGHNDSLPVMLIVVSLMASPPWRLALILLAGGAKLWPAILLPSVLPELFQARLRWQQRLLPAGAALALLLVSLVPYWGDVSENARFLTGFLGGWRNNDSLFGFILWAARGNVYLAKYAAMALVAAGVTALAWWRKPFEVRALAAIVLLLLLSANCHPWYVTWVAPFLVLCPHPALLLWLGLVPLAYEVRLAWMAFGHWEGVSPWRWAIYLPVFAVFLGKTLFAARKECSLYEQHHRSLRRVGGSAGP